MAEEWWQDLPDETLVESAWERQMNISGVEAFELSRLDKNGKARGATETRTGQSALRGMLKDASAGILEMQKGMVGVTRVQRNLKASTIIVPPDTAALITLRSLIDRTYGVVDQESGYNYQSIIQEVSKSIELEMNFRHWVSASQEASKAYAKVKGMTKTPMSIAQRLIEEHGSSRSQIRLWKKSFEELNTYKWDTLELHYCGDALVTAAVKALPKTFEIFTLWKNGKTPKHVRMLEGFREQFDAKEARFATLQVTKKPMIATPRKWKKQEEE